MIEHSPADPDAISNEMASATGLRTSILDEHGTRFLHQDARVDWTKRDADHGNLLQLAVVLGLKDTVSLLLKYGADPNVRDTSQKTALHLAAWFGLSQIVKLLLANGADVYAKDEAGATPLDHAESSIDNDNCAGAYIQHIQEIIVTLRSKIEKIQETDRVGMEFLGPKLNSTILAPDSSPRAKSVFAMPFWNPGVGFHATIVDIWNSEDQEYILLKRPKIEDILHDRWALDRLMMSRSKPKNSSNKLRWIHVPVNNVSQIRDFHRLNIESRNMS